MEINLKQSEIEVALRQYVASQGFNLTGRAVAITFTSGRTANGLTALVDIGDVTEVPAATGQTYRTLELRQSDLPSGAVGTAAVAQVGVDPALPGGDHTVGGTEAGAVVPEAGEAGESPATTAPEAEDTGAAPVSLFAKPQSN
jgi:hypothetical protein